MKKTISLAFIVAAVFWNVFPFLWQWNASLKSPALVSQLPPIFPSPIEWGNYRSVLGNESFLKVIRNSMVVSLGATSISLMIGSMGAFGISRLLDKGKEKILLGLLVIFMIPPVAVVTPFFKVLVDFGLRDTLLGLVLVYTVFAVPLVVWVMYQVFESFPGSLYQAARIDGCGHWRIFYKIYLPLGRSGLVSAALLSFIFCWNEFLFALTFTSTYESRTIPVGISLFSSQFTFPWGEISAASSVVTLPLLLVVLAGQKYLVRGLTGSFRRRTL